jgi:citrate synthase
LTLHADHELNASTFAARVTAATLSDIYSSITSAIGALKGSAARRREPGRDQDAAAARHREEAAIDRVKSTLARKVKIPGFGHRVYRAEDPRATHLRVISEELGKRTGQEKLYLMSQARGADREGEKRLNRQRGFLLGVDLLFAGHSDRPVHAGVRGEPHVRVDGAHAGAIHNNRLIRPRAEYKGNPDGMKWIPMDQR